MLKAGTGKHFDASDVIIGRANCCHVYQDSNNTQQSFCGCPFSHVMLDKHDVELCQDCNGYLKPSEWQTVDSAPNERLK